MRRVLALLPDDLVDELDQAAQRRGVSRNEVIRSAIRRGLPRRKQ